MNSPIDRDPTTRLRVRQRVPTHRSGGFTLFELLIVMGIVAVLAAVAVPAMGTFIQNQRLSSSAAALVYSLNYGRSEALKANSASVSVCASTNGTACDTGTNVWSNGWIVLSSASAIPLQVVGKLTTGNTVTTSPSQASIVFGSGGQTLLANSAGAFVRFTVCDIRGTTYAREIEVTPMGSVQAAPKVGLELDGTTAVPSC